MRTLLRHPGRYLVLHWLVTAALAAALLLPAATQRLRVDRHLARITLITGQAVDVTAGGVPVPAPGLQEGHQFSADWYAVPSTAAAAAGAGLDPVLFDTTYLEANGFNDSATARIPVIVAFSNQAQAARAVQAGQVDGITFTHLFKYVPWASGYVRKTGPYYQPGAVASIREVALDAVVHASPEQVTPQLNDALPLAGNRRGAPERSDRQRRDNRHRRHWDRQRPPGSSRTCDCQRQF
jgi:hypothetical protein